MAGRRVIVVGSVNIDYVVAVPRLPAPGETIAGGMLGRHHGGKGANQAVAAARMGAESILIGAVGSDGSGSEAISVLAREGIDVGHVVRVDCPTGVALVMVDPAGENQIAVAPGANDAVSPAMVRRGLRAIDLRRGDVVVVSREVPQASVQAALAAARAAGATGLLNPAPADHLDAGVLASADVLTPNRSELAVATGLVDPELGARRLVALMASGGSTREAAATRAELPFVAVTLGAHGALLVQPDRPAVVVPGVAVDVTDATGAGDTFNGALAAGLAEGLSPEAAVRRAVHAAALSTRAAGARDGMPTLAEVHGHPPGSDRQPGSRASGRDEV